MKNLLLLMLVNLLLIGAVKADPNISILKRVFGRSAHYKHNHAYFRGQLDDAIKIVQSGLDSGTKKKLIYQIVKDVRESGNVKRGIAGSMTRNKLNRIETLARKGKWKKLERKLKRIRRSL